MIKHRKENDEVLYPLEDIVFVTQEDLAELKRIAITNPRQRVRLCVHSSPNDHLHEMFIVHTPDCYVRPHKHLGKAESMAILEGEADLVLFAEDGTIQNIINMGEPGSGKVFYQRLSVPTYHTLIIRSNFLVFHEITEGPFIRTNTVFPDWAPIDQAQGADDFIKAIELQIKQKDNHHE